MKKFKEEIDKSEFIPSLQKEIETLKEELEVVKDSSNGKCFDENLGFKIKDLEDENTNLRENWKKFIDTLKEELKAGKDSSHRKYFDENLGFKIKDLEEEVNKNESFSSYKQKWKAYPLG